MLDLGARPGRNVGGSRTTAVRWLALLTLAVVVAPVLGQELNGSYKRQAEQALDDMLMGQTCVARVAFPAWKDGIDIDLAGDWDPSRVTRRIKDHGVGIEIGEAAVVTDVKLKKDRIEIHLNGGGYGTFGDAMLGSSSDMRRGDSAKRSGGSRINLRFGRKIRVEDVEPLKLIAWLAPILDAAALERRQALAEIPEEFRDAAERGEIVVGMSKKTVFAVLGEPKDRSVDAAADPPVEKWIYEPDAITTLIVTIQAGVVTKVDRI